jgi:hypothetical protein
MISTLICRGMPLEKANSEVRRVSQSSNRLVCS